MDIQGVLVGCRSYSFPDKQSGELIQGGKLYLAVPSSGAGSSGHELSEIPYDYESHSKISQLVKQNELKLVSVECDVSMRFGKTKLKAVNIKPR